MRSWLCLAMMGVVLGCSSEPTGSGTGGSCPGGLSCAPLCQTAANCSANEVCTSGLCGQPAPTSTEYSACALDADCARGDYCSLGACKHDCLADRDCAGGTVCSSRGRCIAAISVGQPTAVTFPSAGRPVLSCPQGGAGCAVDSGSISIDFGTGPATIQFTLTNSGDQAFDYRLLSSRPWLSVSPFAGSLTKNQSVAITVALNRTAATADSGQGGFIAVNTSAGYLRVSARLATDLTGSWSGALQATSPADLGQHALVVNLAQVGALLNGWVDEDQSPLHPFKSAVGGDVFSENGTEWVSFSFDLTGDPGTAQNPAFPKRVVRHFTFTGTRTGEGTLTGSFSEAFDGLLDGLQSRITGDAVFTRSGPLPDGQPESSPGTSVTSTGNPLVDGAGNPRAAYQACLTCPSGNCSGAAEQNADQFLRGTNPATATGLNFYSAFWSAAQTASGSPFGYIDACAATPSSCSAPFDPLYLRCAQYWAWKGLPTNGSYLFDTLEVTSDYALYLGNAYVARALDDWYAAGASGPSLDQEVKDLQSAERTYVGGLHGNDLARPVSLLDPFYVGVIAQLPAGVLGGSGSGKLTAAPILADPNGRAAGEPVRRALNAMDSALFAANERADRQRRLQKDGDALDSVRQAAVRTWIDLAALGPVFSASGATWVKDVGAVCSHLQDAERRFLEIAGGRNLFGYAVRYVPFLWNKDLAGSLATNYLQIDAQASANQALWKGIYDEAASALRTYEQSAAALTAEFSNQTQVINQQLSEICGAAVTDLSVCGGDYGTTNASLVAQALLELEATAKRIEYVEMEMRNVYAAIQIEESRAAQVAKVHVNQAILITETNERIYADEKAVRAIDAAERASHSFLGGIMSAITSGNPVAVVVGLFGSGVDAASAAAREGYERDIAEQRSLQQSSVEYNAATIELVDSAAKVMTELLQLNLYQIDHDIALLNVVQATARVTGLYRKAAVLLADRVRINALGAANARNALHYRVFSGAKARQAAAVFHDALEWSYLAARAAEYQLADNWDHWNLLWGTASPSDLATALQALRGWTGRTGTAQTNRDVFSLRDDILGLGETVEDAVTGARLAPRERFRRFVADPANRDENGNLCIRFSTLNPDRLLLPATIGSARIKTVSVNLIGDDLGAGVSSAYVKLVHGGTSYLRAWRNTSSGTLVAYDMTATGNRPSVARVHAAINELMTGVAPEQNVQLQDRAVLATGWELVIDTVSEPVNAKLNLLNLDDIEITFVHDSYTIQ